MLFDKFLVDFLSEPVNDPLAYQPVAKTIRQISSNDFFSVPAIV
jgi:hypothetical protein